MTIHLGSSSELRKIVSVSVGWAFGAPKEMKNAASFGNCTFFTTTLSFLSLRAEATCPGVPWRNLQCAFRVPQI